MAQYRQLKAQHFFKKETHSNKKHRKTSDGVSVPPRLEELLAKQISYESQLEATTLCRGSWKTSWGVGFGFGVKIWYKFWGVFWRFCLVPTFFFFGGGGWIVLGKVASQFAKWEA